MRFAENLSTASAVIVGGIILLVSLYSLYIDYSTGKGILNIAIDTVMIFLSAVLIGGGLSTRKRLRSYKVAADRAFEEVVYSKLKPILDEVAMGILEINTMRKKLDSVEEKMAKLENYATTGRLTPEHKVNFYFKALIVMLFYLGTVMFMMQYTLPYNHILAILLFIYWWLFITAEFEIFSTGEALVMLIAPVLIVPSLYILSRVFLGVALAQGVVFLASGVYAYYYYTVAKKVSTGQEVKISRKIRDFVGKFRQ
ncbi:hypothetical protein GAH_00511 [Geoglobus ahangari]|uniref:Uncharacterized protein n=1 Tax=Geoglobus ahangari TaxID=113653 RepID=A0A0F7IGY9_9EURY|nr:hypothetical protein [Geoglobus ahangari]AKG92142.1 hypothetical protein GAH_00511 [Geoglobus ahangari]